jgi:hypothetical protein
VPADVNDKIGFATYHLQWQRGYSREEAASAVANAAAKLFGRKDSNSRPLGVDAIIKICNTWQTRERSTSAPVVKFVPRIIKYSRSSLRANRPSRATVERDAERLLLGKSLRRTKARTITQPTKAVAKDFAKRRIKALELEAARRGCSVETLENEASALAKKLLSEHRRPRK